MNKMLIDLCKVIKHNTLASIGIGGLIIFISIVLIAGVAATVLVQTSTTIESQAASTGTKTKSEVSAGLSVYSVEGYAADGEDISKLAIMIRPLAGTEGISLLDSYIELSDTNKKVISNYSTSYYSDPDGLSNIFNANVFPDLGSQFGIIVLEDFDNSVSQLNPVINRGDKLFLCLNLTASFSDISENTDVWGRVVPEIGHEGIINFRTPSSFIDNVMELQWNM
jgi:flagellin FlaB